jgi:hypothetical protein
MAKRTDSHRSNSAVEELVTELLGCGAVLSQMISQMVEFEASGRSAPDAAPIPTVAHELIAGVLTDIKHRHSRRDLKVAAAIVGEVTESICQNIFFVDLDKLEEPGIDCNPGDEDE